MTFDEPGWLALLVLTPLLVVAYLLARRPDPVRPGPSWPVGDGGWAPAVAPAPAAWRP
jgi:hypothetical protein